MAVSTKQLTFYYEVCERKGALPKDVSSMTGFQISQEIEHLLTLPNRASENQLNMLRSMLQELTDAGVPGVKVPSDKFFQSLNFDMASKWIENTRQMRAKFFHVLPATDTQIERLADMYLFPEVEWESVTKEVEETVETYVQPTDGGESILRTVETKRQTETVIQRKIYLDEEINGVKLWRFMTREEFKKELTKLTHQQASNLLDRYTGSYQAWLRTRITLGQKQQIRQIENRLASIFTPREVTAFDLDQPFDMEQGDTNVEHDTPFHVNSKKLDNWNPVAYEGLKEEQLDMMSREEADQYIRQLRYELQNTELRNIGGAQNLDYPDYSIEEARTAKSEADARTKEFKELNNFLYGLSDITGHLFEVTDKHGNPQTVDSMRHDALQVFFKHNTRAGGVGGASEEQKAELRSQIAEYVRYAVLSKAIKFAGLMNLADRSEIANQIIDELCEDADFAKQLIQLQRSQF